MSKLPQPIDNYVSRFNEQYIALNIVNADYEIYEKIVKNNSSQLNNLLMSGLGACTLLLRLGAVINLAKKLDRGSDEEDTLLMKQILDNLREVLPTDSNWKTIWEITCDVNSKWQECVNSEKGKQSLMEKFVTFRNKYVHGVITMRPDHAKNLMEGITILNELCTLVSPLFEYAKIEESEGVFYFVENTNDLFSKSLKTSLYPFVQGGYVDGLPYIFQGLYDNKQTAELISTFHGDIEEQEGSQHYEAIFNPMLKALKGGTGRIFNHEDILNYYAECFVGREIENEEIINWVLDDSTTKNIMPIYSQAGMGKGALVANLVSNLSNNDFNIPVLHHFCGNGIANNLHAIVYHLILQGKKSQLWNLEDPVMAKKVNRLPSKYHDAITLFHELLNDFVITRNNKHECLVIVIDGLDEAAVAYSEFHIKDYFSNYDENGEVTEAWECRSNIKWIFTYREGFYNFPELTNIFSLERVQPLQGLSIGSIETALKVFNPSIEFKETVAERGRIIK